MTQMENIIAEVTRRIFRDLGDPQALNGAADERWRTPLWRALEESALTKAWVPEPLDGAGARIADGFEILGIAGGFAVALPLAETLLAGWLLSRAGLRVPRGMLSVAPVRAGEGLKLGDDGKLSGFAASVPFARDVGHFAVVARRGKKAVIALVERAHCALRPGSSIAGEPRDDITFENGAPVSSADAPPEFRDDALMLMGAAVRAAQMSGALQSILERCVAYAKERVAFERPIGGFQAIKHMLADMFVAAKLAESNCYYAAWALSTNSADLPLAAATARVSATAAFQQCARDNIQVHGGMGFTWEFDCHLYYRRSNFLALELGGLSTWEGRVVANLSATAA